MCIRFLSIKNNSNNSYNSIKVKSLKLFELSLNLDSSNSRNP